MAKPKMRASKNAYPCCYHCEGSHSKYPNSIHTVPCNEYVYRDGNRVRCQEYLKKESRI